MNKQHVITVNLHENKIILPSLPGTSYDDLTLKISYILKALLFLNRSTSDMKYQKQFYYKIGVAGFAAASLGSFLFITGIFVRPKFKDTVINKKIFVYRDNTGDYSRPQLVRLLVEAELKNIDKWDFIPTKLSGDSPSDLESNNEGRPIFGGVFNFSRRGDIEEFVKKHPSYHMVDLDDLQAVSAQLPQMFLFRSMMSWKKVYSRLAQNASQKDGFKEQNLYFFELYHRHTFPRVGFYSNRYPPVQLLIPYGKNSEAISFERLKVMK